MVSFKNLKLWYSSIFVITIATLTHFPLFLQTKCKFWFWSDKKVFHFFQKTRWISMWLVIMLFFLTFSTCCANKEDVKVESIEKVCSNKPHMFITKVLWYIRHCFVSFLRRNLITNHKWFQKEHLRQKLNQRKEQWSH